MLTLHQQRKRLNQIFDTLINNTKLPEQEFDKAMEIWIDANKKLEKKEENHDFYQRLNNTNKSTWQTVV